MRKTPDQPNGRSQLISSTNKSKLRPERRVWYNVHITFDNVENKIHNQRQDRPLKTEKRGSMWPRSGQLCSGAYLRSKPLCAVTDKIFNKGLGLSLDARKGRRHVHAIEHDTEAATDFGTGYTLRGAEGVNTDTPMDANSHNSLKDIVIFVAFTSEWFLSMIVLWLRRALH